MNHAFRRHMLALFALLTGLMIIQSVHDVKAAGCATKSVFIGCTNGIGDRGAMIAATEVVRNELMAPNYATVDLNQSQLGGVVYTQAGAMRLAYHHFGPDVVQIKADVVCLNYQRSGGLATVRRPACPL
ncbi:MAG: hypothetical protein KA586_11165 [Candidatus Promineofilum sp.]|nr:hypothetical protein [Promineifilum sp.]